MSPSYTQHITRRNIVFPSNHSLAARLAMVPLPCFQAKFSLAKDQFTRFHHAADENHIISRQRRGGAGQRILLTKTEKIARNSARTSPERRPLQDVPMNPPVNTAHQHHIAQIVRILLTKKQDMVTAAANCLSATQYLNTPDWSSEDTFVVKNIYRIVLVYTHPFGHAHRHAIEWTQ